jgi:radical SAM superfamily enzyme YgiQ (UPF0313 family)
MKLALLSSPASDSSEALPLGAASMAAAIKTRSGLAAVELFLVEGKPGEDSGELASRVASGAPDAVGFSVYSWNREAFRDAAHRLRALLPGVVLFAGGPETTADPQSFVAEAGLDFAIAGEGETASAEALSIFLAAGLGTGPGRDGSFLGAAIPALRRVPGLVLPGEPWLPSPPEEGARLPSPWLSGILDPAKCGGEVVWELSRGCPFHCAYCYESKGSSGSRPFSTERIEAELELFVRSGVRYAFVLDPTFDADSRRASALLELFRARAPGIRWKFEVRAELLDAVLVRRFAALDCSLQIGLQSVRADTLAVVGRPGFDRREFARKAAMLSRAGVTFGLDLIYGLPGDRLHDFEEALDFALGLGPNHLDLFPLALLPGTELAERAGELGVEADPRPPYIVRATRELSAGDLAKAALLASACDRFYSAGRAIAWFEAARKPLRARPSSFLYEYAAWLAERGGPGKPEPVVIEAEQIDFLEHMYGRAGLGSLLPALCDLVRLHGAYGRALAEGAESVLELSYDPEESLGAVASGLPAFVRAASPSRGTWRVLPDEEDGARIERASSYRRKAAEMPQGSQAATKTAALRPTKAK